MRDVRADLEESGRAYIPCIDFNNFIEEDKFGIQQDIQHDFKDGYQGIKRLRGWACILSYYKQLFKKISYTVANIMLQKESEFQIPAKWACI